MKVKKLGLYALTVALLVCGIAILSVSAPAKKATASGISLEGEGDRFEYSAQSYDAGEAFVYVSAVQFEHGNAAGLVFGGQNDSCFVFNVDRAENRVKLMYFYDMEETRKVETLKEEYYVGSSIMNDGERNYVKSRTANIDKVYLKVAVNADGTAEFYADGIQRFAFTDGSKAAEKIDINGFTLADETPIRYNGGLLGYNCFNAKVNFTDTRIGKTDYGYYGELYRNQYHFSQFAHWNNDPNGLVYYNGYYHLYFQHNPYGNTWDDMHWGHARSTDLVHWELLPIALVPDRDLPMEGDDRVGAMWSGSARVYHKGDSATIDGRDWFDVTGKNNGDALGLIGYYTRYDKGGNRHQILMYSTDGGLTWNKRDNIPCTVSEDLNGNVITGGSWRDPKVFDISVLDGAGDYKWGMALTDMEDNILFFLKSKDLVTWEHAGSYYVYRPECPDVVNLTTKSGKTHTVITFTSRYYVVCDLVYRDGNIVMTDPSSGEPIDRLEQNSPNMRIMDYGVDSYAAQTFYIDDAKSAYNGKAVGVSWFSGVPNAPASIESGVLASARKVWNGGGMTIPVVYGLKEKNGNFILTTAPITVGDESGFDKTPLDGLDDITGHCFEIDATVKNDGKQPVYFRINTSVDGNRYTEIGWNTTDGYYVDRTHTEDAGIHFPKPNYACKYASGMGKDNTSLDFYILSDNGGVEVYCDGFTVPFYILTFASPYSVKASLTADSSATATVKVNEIASVWRSGASDETLINLSDTHIDVGTELGQTQTLTAYAQGKKIGYEVITGADAIRVEPTVDGARITGLKAGEAQIRVTAGASSRTVDVTVHSGSVESDCTFASDGIVSGQWYYSGDTLVGEQSGGDGFILAKEGGGDFTYTARFDLGSGAAAALVFRATAENRKLTSYLIANYDNNSKIVKLWSQNGELGNVPAGNPDITNLTLTAETKGKNVKVFLNGNKLIDCTIRDSDPVSGKFGLNVCATRATFSLIAVQKSEYEYTGSGDLTIKSSVEQQVLEIVNTTLYNTVLSQGQYQSTGRDISIKQSYWELLPSAGDYTFTVYGSEFDFTVIVSVARIPKTELTAVTVDEGINVTIWLGNSDVLYVKVNGEELDENSYKIVGNVLTVTSDVFVAGENTVSVNDGQSVSVTVREVPKQAVSSGGESRNSDVGLIVGLSVGIPVPILLAVAVAVAVLLYKKKTTEKREKEE